MALSINNRVALIDGKFAIVYVIKSMWCNGSTLALGAWGGVRIAHILLTKKGKRKCKKLLTKFQKGSISK